MNVVLLSLGAAFAVSVGLNLYLTSIVGGLKEKLSASEDLVQDLRSALDDVPSRRNWKNDIL